MSVLNIEDLAEAVTGFRGSKFLDDPSMHARLSLWSEKAGRLGRRTLEAVWAPFDHIQRDAKLVIVGITPGRYQAEAALSALRTARRAGIDLDAAMALAKRQASFSGDLRTNLCRMLDHVGAPKWLGVPRTVALWEPGCAVVHFTSALRHPVFYDGKDYSGAPKPLSVGKLRAAVETDLAEEVRALPDAYWLPLWDTAASALHHLVEQGVLCGGRVLEPLPHPAGGNCENIAHFVGTKIGPLSSRRAGTGDLVLSRRDELARFFDGGHVPASRSPTLRLGTHGPRLGFQP